jgi:nitrogen fixation protein NifB
MTSIPLALLARRPQPGEGAAGDPAGGPTRAPVDDPAPARGCASTKGCGASSTGLDPAVAAKVATHPCYSQEAHQFYARMHIPVAPGCNIQCHYCNRKFDCTNESRPGVTSTLLSPEQALAKVKHVAGQVQQLSVVGVAGPGEPLAHAARTLATLELIARHCPDLTLCLSTNGLTLLDHVDRIAGLGVDHVTITINMTDPEVGEQIYPWITYRGRKYTGKKAARVLSERQLEGLQALTERGILCKVNSVMIPGVNDEHLIDVSRTVRDLGAFLHNVMPLVSAPEHGTHYGLNGRRGPTPQELKAVQDRCEQLSGGMAMGLMRHCRQCRADAIGLLGQDRGEQFAQLPSGGADAPGVAMPDGPGYDLAGRQETHHRIEEHRSAGRARREQAGVSDDPARRPDGSVLVAVASSGGGVVNQHFGHADEFFIYEAGPGFARLVGTRSVSRYCTGPSECGDDAASLQDAVRMLSDCAAVLCSRAGAGPRRLLAAAGIDVVEVYDAIEQAVAAAGARLVAARRPQPEATG